MVLSSVVFPKPSLCRREFSTRIRVQSRLHAFREQTANRVDEADTPIILRVKLCPLTFPQRQYQKRVQFRGISIGGKNVEEFGQELVKLWPAIF